MGIRINGNRMFNGRVDSNKKISKIKFGDSLVWEYKAPEYLYIATNRKVIKYNIKTLTRELTHDASSNVIGSAGNNLRISVDEDFLYYGNVGSGGGRILNKEDFSSYYGTRADIDVGKIISRGDYVYIRNPHTRQIVQYSKSSMTKTNSYDSPDHHSYPSSSYYIGHPFTVDDDYIYITYYDELAARLYVRKIDISTGLEVSTSPSIASTLMEILIEDGDYVYYTQLDRVDNLLYTRALLKSDMSMVQSYYYPIGRFNRMVIDGDYLYGVSEDAVTKVHKTNFSKTDIITGTFSSTGIAVSRDKIFVALKNGSINIYSKTDYSLLGNFTTGGSVSDMQIGT